MATDQSTPLAQAPSATNIQRPLQPPTATTAAADTPADALKGLTGIGLDVPLSTPSSVPEEELSGTDNSSAILADLAGSGSGEAGTDIGRAEVAPTAEPATLPRTDVTDSVALSSWHRASVHDTGTQLDSVLLREPYFAKIPTPYELFRDLSVVATNLLLAIILALVMGISTTVLDEMLESEEEFLQRWLDRIPPVRWAQQMLSASGQTLRGWWTASGWAKFIRVAGIFIVYGVTFSLLDSGAKIVGSGWLFVILTTAASVGLISLVGELAAWWMASRWRLAASIEVFPSNLMLAFLSVLLSRGLALSPGIIFGAPGALEIAEQERMTERQEQTLMIVGVVATIVTGTLFWALSIVPGWLQLSLGQSGPVTLVLVVLVAAQSLCLMIFLVALETLFFELVPVSYTTGRDLFQWNKLVWALLFVPTAFLFTHVMLNPDSDFLTAFEQRNVRLVLITVLSFAAFVGALWAYFRWRQWRHAKQET